MDESTKENIEMLKNDLQNLKDEVYEKGELRISEIKDRAIEKRKKMKEYIQANPEKSILMALGAGFVAGIIISLIRRR